MASIVVVGDVMLDRTVSCEVSRVSPEAPVVVGKQCAAFAEALGGAGNVAANVRSLGFDVTLVSMVGSDQDGRRISELCGPAEIVPVIREVGDGFRTTTKTRYVSAGSLVFRFDQEWHDGRACPVFPNELWDDCAAVILSDYNKGALLSSDFTRHILDGAHARGIVTIADFKPANAHLFREACVVSPNQAELCSISVPLRDAATLRGQSHAPRGVDDFSMRLFDVLEMYKFGAIACTRGSEGISLYCGPQHESDPNSFVHFPSQARQVFDVTGAGDTVVAALATRLAEGGDSAENLRGAVAFANAAASVAVERHGTVVVRREQALLAQSDFAARRKIVALSDLQHRLEGHKETGKSIVFTNGCFDLLHAGHAHLLKYAAAQGDILIAALNSDRTIASLKGEDRPVLPLAVRMRSVAALPMVDYVVPFDEPTPEQLIRKLCPDVLVKGADAQDNDVPGAEYVASRGGRVHFVDVLAGYSTTQTTSVG